MGSTKLLFTFILLVPLSVFAEVSPSVLIHSSSNSVYNGLTENNNRSSVAINAEVVLKRHWTFGAQLQDSEPADIRQRERIFTSYLGYDYQLSNNWLGSAYAVNRQFLSAARNWDYDEFSLRLSHKNGASLGISYAPNYYSCSVKGIGTTLGYSYKLSDKYYTKTQVGNFNIQSIVSYQFANAAVGVRFDRFNLELAYHWTSKRDIQTRIGPISSPQFAVNFSYLAF